MPASEPQNQAPSALQVVPHMWKQQGHTLQTQSPGSYLWNQKLWKVLLEKLPGAWHRCSKGCHSRATMSHLAPCARNIFVQRNTRGHGYSPEWHMEQIYQRPTKKSPKHTESLIFILGIPYSLLFPKDYFPNLGIRLTRLRPDLLLMAKAYTSLPLMCIHWFKHHNIMKLCLCFIYGDKWGNQG